MPIFRHKVTGLEDELPADFAAVFGDVFELVKDEGPEERRARLQKEAADNKVTFEDENGNEITGAEAPAVAPKAEGSK